MKISVLELYDDENLAFFIAAGVGMGEY